MIPVILGLYLLFCATGAAYLFFHTWLGNFAVMHWCFPGASFDDQFGGVATLSFTVSGAILGAVIRSFRGLHVYAASQGNFKMSYSGSYLLGPWAAAFLGLVMYGVVRGGLFVFGGLEAVGDPNEATQLGYFGMGFLTGFAWDRTLEKLNTMAGELLASAKNTASTQPVNGQQNQKRPDDTPKA